MKLPKDRPLNDYLINLHKKQQRRIKECGTDAYINQHMYDIAEEQGTYFSHRFKR